MNEHRQDTVTVDREYPHAIQALLMRAIGEPMTLQKIHLKAVGPDDVRVRIEQVGVCHSDLSVTQGILPQLVPAVLGHEACGTVIETGTSVTDLSKGQRVILLWITPCGRCFHCTHGQPNLCIDGSRRAGMPYAVTDSGEPIFQGLSVAAFAEQTVLPRSAVVPVPDDIDTADAALLGCAVTTGVGAAMVTAQIVPEASVVVVGLGGVGLSVVQGARLAGATTIIAVDRNANKASAALACGAHHFLPADQDTRSAVQGLTDMRGADYAFDCVGSSTTIRDMWAYTRRGGSCTIVGVGSRDDRAVQPHASADAWTADLSADGTHVALRRSRPTSGTAARARPAIAAWRSSVSDDRSATS